jgi:hypothetical protein|tara:strand:+ start:1425 stop:1640 length:216 start_codon:yes stop_codon:yes gene_type:complete
MADDLGYGDISCYGSTKMRGPFAMAPGSYNKTTLYNLDGDLRETNDLAKKEPKRALKLLQELNQWIKETAR